MKVYLLRTRGINNKYYPDKDTSYIFGKNTKNASKLLEDIIDGGVKYYLYYIPTNSIIEEGDIKSYSFNGRMYEAEYEYRSRFTPPLKLEWPSPNPGIIPLDEENIEKIKMAVDNHRKENPIEQQKEKENVEMNKENTNENVENGKRNKFRRDMSSTLDRS